MEFSLFLEEISDNKQDLHRNADDSRKPDQFNLICNLLVWIKEDNPWL